MSAFMEAIEVELFELIEQRVQIEAKISQLEEFKRSYADESVPTGTVKVQPKPKASKKVRPAPKAQRPAVIPSSKERPETTASRDQIGKQRREKVLEALKGGPLSRPDIIKATGLTAGSLQVVLNQLVESGNVERTGATRSTRYGLAKTGAPQPPVDGRPAPLPPPERTQLQDRISMLVAAMPLTTVEIANELGANVLKTEHACEALKKRGEIDITDGTWGPA